MERAAAATLRRCLRSGQTLRCHATASTAKRCVATAICPARHGHAGDFSTSSLQTSTAAASSRRSRTSLLTSSPSRRPYTSSPQGTIGEGEAGIAKEAARSADILTAPSHLNEAEKEIYELLSSELQPTELEVQDISGGCGSMYGIDVASERFRGLSMLKQQRLVNGVLGERVKNWHGVQLKTRCP